MVENSTPYSSSQSEGASYNKKKRCHQPRRASTDRNGAVRRARAVVVVAAEASRVHGGLGHFAVHLEAGGGLPTAEQDAPEVRPAAVGAAHGCPDLGVVLAVQDLEVLGVVNQDVEGLRRRRVLGLATHEPPSDLGKRRHLDTAARGEYFGETGLRRLLVTHITALTFICFDVLESNASQTLIIRKGRGLAGSTVAVDQCHELIGRVV
jgi:hypothetical protein